MGIQVFHQIRIHKRLSVISDSRFFMTPF